MPQSERSEPTRISFVRHGRVHNPQKIIYGRLPRFRLNDQGAIEARAAAKRLKNARLAALYSSPMLRARQTAREILSYHNGLRLRVSSLINEVCSPYQGRPNAEADRVNWNLYAGTGCDFEQPTAIAGRVARFIGRSRRRYPGRQVAAVTHGDVIAFTVLWAMGIEPHADHRLDMRRHGFPDRYPATGSIVTLVFESADRPLPHDIDYWCREG